MNGNLIETKKSKITFEESDYYDNYHDPMISNPMRFDSMGQSSPSSSFSNQDNSQFDGSKMRGQNEDNSNPITARFVVAKRGMNVILECHDRDVTSVPTGGRNNGNNSPNEDSNTDEISEPQNYVWRKEGGKHISFPLKITLIKTVVLFDQ